MGGACYFSKLDLHSGYHQLELDAELAEITTFSTPVGLHRHNRLTLGVTTASRYYQQTLETKFFYDLRNMCNIQVDIIIWEKSQHEHDFYLQKALQQVWDHELKCLFNLPNVTLFGMVLSKNGISINETKIQAIKKLEKPGNISELSDIPRQFYT